MESIHLQTSKKNYLGSCGHGESKEGACGHMRLDCNSPLPHLLHELLHLGGGNY
jgi:hypothetical protein